MKQILRLRQDMKILFAGNKIIFLIHNIQNINLMKKRWTFFIYYDTILISDGFDFLTSL